MSLPELKAGEIRQIKMLRGGWVHARFLEAHQRDTGKRMMTHWTFQSLISGRTITIKSRAKMRALPELNKWLAGPGGAK